MSDWIKTKDRLPAKPGNSSYELVDCWIYHDGNVLRRPWNCEHECWDDSEYDDFEFDALTPSHWMQFNEPIPPIEDTEMPSDTVELDRMGKK